MLKIADFLAFCRVFRRTIFASVLCFFALFSFGEKSSAYAVDYYKVDYKFTMTTTNLSAGDTVDFSLTASGTFYVDCGNGGVLTSSNNDVTGNDVTGLTGAYTITRYNTTPVTYTCTYASIGGVKTMRFGGLATGYGGGRVFGVGLGDYCKIASVSGNMSAVFPQLGPNQNQLPKFTGMFDSCSTLTSISGDLFANITTGTEWMFAQTFMQTGLTSIPSNLFANITTGAPYMFYMTFFHCDNLQSFPADLFIGITNAEESMFQQTFYGVGGAATALTGSFVSPDFFAGLVTNQSPYATNMMLDVFNGAHPLMRECPEDHYQYITGYENYWSGAVSCKKCPNNPVYTHSPAGSTSINQCVPTNIVFDCGTAASGGSWIGGQLSLNHNNLSCYDNVNIQMPNNSTTINNCHASSLASVQGWNCAQGDTSLGTNLQPGTNFTQQCMPYDNVDVVCTAQWAYPISYGSGNHGSVPNNGADPVVYANGLTYGSAWTTKTFAETGIVADTGYVFTHWNTSADGTGTSYAANTLQSARTTDSGLTLYAVYGCDTANGYELVNNECVQQTCAEGESLNVLDDLNLFKPEGTLSGFGFDMNGVLFGEGHHEYLNETPNTFGVWNVDQDEFLLGSAMCSKDDEGFSPAYSLNVDSQNPEANKYCWCSLTGGVQKDAQYPLSPSTWVYLTGDLGSYCEKYCAEYCAGSGLRYSGDYRDFIRKLLRQKYCIPKQYKVSYYCEDRSWLDGEEPLFVDTVFYGSSGYSFYGDENMTLAEPCAPAGYLVDGFKCFTATNEDPVDDSVANPWTINDDVVCLASYAPNYYTITLNKVNGSGGANKVYTRYNTNVYRDSNRNVPMTYPGQSGHNSASNITVPTKSGFVFDGYWSATGNNGLQYIDENGYITQNGLNVGKFVTNNNAIWYAHWLPTYNIHYRSQTVNGHNISLTVPGALIYGRSWSLLSYDHNDPNFVDWPDPNGSVFDKWCTNADGTGTCYNPGVQSGNWNQQSDLTVYAIYDCATGYVWNNSHTQCLKTYDVEYHACDEQYLDNNDTTGLLTYTLSRPNPQYIALYEQTGLKSIKTGYHYLDTWLDGNNVSHETGDSEQINLDDNTSPLQLYAQCVANQTNVRYYCGEDMVHSDYATYDQSYTFYNNANACSPCAMVTGWNCSYVGQKETLSNRPYSGSHDVGQTVTWNDPMDDYPGSESGYDCVAVMIQGNSYQITYSGGTATNPNNPNSATHDVTTVAMSPQNVHYGDQNVTLNANTYSQEGYNFDGWSCTGTVCGQQTSDTFTVDDDGQNIGTYKFGTNLACTAQWTPKKYTVTYDYGAHAANNATGVAYTHINGAMYDANYTVPEAANDTITPATGYRFVGWNTSSGQTTENWTGATPWTQTTGLTVYAAYACDTANGYAEYNNSCEKKYDVNFYCHEDDVTNGVIGYSDSPRFVGENYNGLNREYLSNCGSCREPGHKFAGWSCYYTDNGVTYSVSNGDIVEPFDITCVPDWDPLVTDVSYNPGAHGSGGNYVTDGLEYGQSYAPFSGNAANITPDQGYTFIGWSQTSGSSTADFCSATATTACVGSTQYWPGTNCNNPDLTLYAVYACDTGYTMNSNNECVAYTLSYAPGDSNNEASGGISATGSMNPSQHAGNSSVTLTPNGFAAPTGYHFNRWVCTKDGVNENNNVQVTESSGIYSITMPNNNVTCTAQWAPNEIELTWLLNNGNWMIDGNENELSNQNSCDYGTSNGITVYDPVRRGFGFIGWEVEGVSGQ